jgi:hypothetical protein
MAVGLQWLCPTSAVGERRFRRVCEGDVVGVLVRVVRVAWWRRHRIVRSFIGTTAINAVGLFGRQRPHRFRTSGRAVEAQIGVGGAACS